MLLYHRDPDDGGDVDGRLDPGGGLEGRPLHAVHRGGRTHSPALQHGPLSWLLKG